MKAIRQFMILFLLLLLAVQLGSLSIAAQDSVLKDLEGRTISVAVENAYPPFNYLDEATGEAVGWDYDVVAEICVRLNCVPEFIETAWDGMIIAVSNGEFDVAADGITITADRAEIVDFSEGYAKIVQRLLVGIDEDRFATVADFVAGDFVVGVQLGTTNYITAQELVGDARIVSYDQFGQAVQALIAGDVDAVVIDDIAGQGYTSENAESVRLFAEAIRADEELGFVFPPGSELVAAFNAALTSMIADGSLNTINASYGLDPYSGIGLLPDLGGRTISVAVENAYPPFNFLDSTTGEPVGWDYDVVTELCVRLNCVPEFIETAWDGMIIAIENGEFDMAADGITITAEREEIVDFSIGYAQIAQRLLVRIDEDRFASIEEFVAGDYTVGVQLGTTNAITAEDLVGVARITSYDQFGQAVQALIAGDVDAVVIDDIAGQGYTSENADAVRLLDEAIRADEELGFVFPPDSELLEAFNSALRSMITDGSLDTINATWGLGVFLGGLE